MKIREATPDDNDELIQLQTKCPQGTTLIASTVNTPDFFARAKAYEIYKVYVAIDNNRIVGSGACAFRDVTLGGSIRRVAHTFQHFVHPEYRRRGVASQIHNSIEDYITQQGAVLSYGYILEENIPSMGFFERQGWKRHHILTMRGIPVFTEMSIESKAGIRLISSDDLNAVSELINKTWEGYELYEPVSAETFAEQVNRTPAYSFDNIFVLEDHGEILACLGFWDWSQVMQITVESLSFKMQVIGLILQFTNLFRPMPRRLKPGDILKQMVLTPIAYKHPELLIVLIRYVNNQALVRGIEQIFLILEREHPLLGSTKGFIHIDNAMHLYYKPLQQNVSLSNNPLFVNGIDL